MRLKVFTLALVAVSATGCQGWRQLPRPTAGGSLAGNPEVVRVTRTQNCGPTPSRECISRQGSVTLYNPRVQGDSLVGYYDSNQRERVSMHVRDVVSVESREVSKGRTMGVAIGSGVVIGLIVAAATVVAVFAALGSN